MFKCDDCGAFFTYDELEEVTETHGLPCPPYEKISVCPHCKSTNYDEYKEGDEE